MQTFIGRLQEMTGEGRAKMAEEEKAGNGCGQKCSGGLAEQGRKKLNGESGVEGHKSEDVENEVSRNHEESKTGPSETEKSKSDKDPVPESLIKKASNLENNKNLNNTPEDKLVTSEGNHNKFAEADVAQAIQ
eukprot:TRINITY_DN9446_c0_g2_i2.p2 TRINITY_DN9446_c0_g2~~TRINITY_DN9446_c0_g2_i2.p2  ORF type:complete len:133 (+),score=39.21 TRINITY_DN9446_c0_g2_i2:1318-1716(+)